MIKIPESEDHFKEHQLYGKFKSFLLLKHKSIISGDATRSKCIYSNQVEDDTEILIRYNVRGRGPKFWTGT